MIRTTLATISALLALALPATAADDFIPSPALRGSISVTSDVVRIGDLVDNAGSAAQIPVYRSPDLGTTGTLTLYVDQEPVGSGTITTQPGYFCLTGDGICVGRDSASAVTPAYRSPFPFRGGTIDKVVVDVSGTPYIDHESQVRGWFLLD